MHEDVFKIVRPCGKAETIDELTHSLRYSIWRVLVDASEELYCLAGSQTRIESGRGGVETEILADCCRVCDNIVAMYGGSSRRWREHGGEHAKSCSLAGAV